MLCLELTIEGMHCDACVESIRRALRTLPCLERQWVEIGRVKVMIDESITTRGEVIGVISDAGPFRVTGFETLPSAGLMT